MKIQGIKREASRPLWARLKKHDCPQCGGRLALVKNSKVVNSESEEGKNFDFSSGDVYLVGNVKFVWDEFQCPTCGKAFSLDKIRSFEKRAK